MWYWGSTEAEPETRTGNRQFVWEVTQEAGMREWESETGTEAKPMVATHSLVANRGSVLLGTLLGLPLSPAQH